MALALTSADLTGLESTTRALLSPLVAPSAEAWLLNVGARMRELFGASLFVATPFPDPDFRALCPDDLAFGEALGMFTSARADGNMAYHDPVLDAWSSRMEPSGVTTWEGNRRVVEPMGYRIEESRFVSDACRPAGLDDFATMHHTTTAGFAAMVVMAERRGALRFGESVPDVLRLLAPAFQTGLDVLARLGAYRHALDAVAEPLVALDPDGRELHRNPALVALLEADPERALVDAALWTLARDLRRLAFTGGPLAPVQRALATAAGRYTLSASVAPAGALRPTETALVSVAFAEESATAAARAAATARTRYGLTAREAEVAALLARGLSNAAIAERLFVSPATVKRHVEGVLAKLDVASRAAVAPRLLGPARPQPL